MHIYIYVYTFVCSSRKAEAFHSHNEMEEKPTGFSDSLTLSLITQVGSEFYMHAIRYQNKYMFKSICSFDTDNTSIIHAKFDHIFNSK